MDNDTKTPSQSPGEKSRTERYNKTLAAFTDWASIAALTYLTACGHVDKEHKVYVLIAIAVIGSPSAVGSLLNRLGLARSAGGSLSALLATLATKGGAGKAAAAALKAGGMSLLVLIGGCGAGIYESTLEARNETAMRLNQVQPLVVALCSAGRPECDDARKAYQAAEAAVGAVDAALEAYRVTGEGVDEVARAVGELERAVVEVVHVATE